MYKFFKHDIALLHFSMQLFLKCEIWCIQWKRIFVSTMKLLWLCDKSSRALRWSKDHPAKSLYDARIHSTQRQTDDPWRIHERCYKEPFSRIVKVKSPRVWDVICSTLVLYRSTTGLDRGVGVFKGDYTQRQGWLYWRMSPGVLIYIIKNFLGCARINNIEIVRPRFYNCPKNNFCVIISDNIYLSINQ